jgi:hypothetical protein
MTTNLLERRHEERERSTTPEVRPAGENPGAAAARLLTAGATIIGRALSFDSATFNSQTHQISGQ